MNNNYIDNENRFISTNYSNTTVTALNTVLNHIDFNDTISLHNIYNNEVEDLWNDKKEKDVKNLVLILTDSLGVENIRETSILNPLLNKNTVVDSVFPTMTATNMVSLSHIANPAQHGLVGYNIYNENINRLFNSLNMNCLSDEGEKIHVEKLGMKKENIITGDSLITKLKSHANICNQTLFSEIFYPYSLDSEGLAKYLFEDLKATTYPDFDPVNILTNIFTSLSKPLGDIQIQTIYFPHTDYASHYYTAQSDEYLNTVKLLSMIIEKLSSHPTVISGETAIVLTSDHGQVRLPTGSNRVQISENDVKTHSQQKFSVGTSGRVLHIYYDDQIGQKNADKFLDTHFSNSKNGIVLEQKEAGILLGNDPTQLTLERLGKKIVLMDENYYLDYPEVVPFGEKKQILAQHGGMSSREVKVPFIII